jgi:hypothetical protein
MAKTLTLDCSSPVLDLFPKPDFCFLEGQPTVFPQRPSAKLTSLRSASGLLLFPFFKKAAARSYIRNIS